MPYASKSILPLSSCNITLSDLEKQLPLTEKHLFVQTGRYTSPLEDTPYIAYVDDSFALFCYVEDNIVAEIWFDGLR